MWFDINGRRFHLNYYLFRALSFRGLIRPVDLSTLMMRLQTGWYFNIQNGDGTSRGTISLDAVRSAYEYFTTQIEDEDVYCK